MIDLGEHGYRKASTFIRPLSFAHVTKVPATDSPFLARIIHVHLDRMPVPAGLGGLY
ncbi:MAG: hypothetical protein ACFFCW_48025 [Candidatus Hodarchaeota archaeon]